VFDSEPLLRFIDRLRGVRSIPIIAGIWPLASLRNAEFMKNEVPGVYVPESVVARMARCDTKESGLEEGIAIARELLEKLRKVIGGVQVAAPMGKVQNALNVLGL
jgi:homocysteine S-methyltransferase